MVVEGFIYKNLVFTHIPIMDRNNVYNCINIHGHTHGKHLRFDDKFDFDLYNQTKRIPVGRGLFSLKEILD